MMERLRCWLGIPVYVWYDPTGGDPYMGGPVQIQVCASCMGEKETHR